MKQDAFFVEELDRRIELAQICYGIQACNTFLGWSFCWSVEICRDV
jgi:hypothetical protein